MWVASLPVPQQDLVLFKKTLIVSLSCHLSTLGFLGVAFYHFLKLVCLHLIHWQDSEAAMHHVACSKECPPGESRDSLGVPRQVCRCPPKEVPPMNFQINSDNDDTEEFQTNEQAPREETEEDSPSEESEDDDESEDDFSDMVNETPESFPG